MKWFYRLLIAIAVLVVGVIALAYWVALRAENPVGFQVSRATDPDGKPIAVGVWYPSESRGLPTAQVGTVLMEVAQGAPVKGRALPLVVISHGNGGGLQSHADLALALASAGYVVAAPMHAGDNFMDLSASGSAALYNGRNRQFLAAIEHMLSQWPGHELIDAEKVGVFGFSAGGFTVLTAAGAQPDMAAISKHCARAAEFVCDVLRQFKSPLLNADAPAGEPMRASPKIKAVVAAAPGLTFTMSAAALSGVRVPVQLWSGDKDDKVPYATNTKVVQDALGQQVEFHAVQGANHLSFLAPCGLIKPAEICADPAGFDRKAFHTSMNAEVVKFFDRNLKR